MASNEYIYPDVVTVDDNLSNTGLFVLPRRNMCGTVGFTDNCEEGQWNNNLCSNDTPYYQPVCAGVPGNEEPYFDSCECPVAKIIEFYSAILIADFESAAAILSDFYDYYQTITTVVSCNEETIDCYAQLAYNCGYEVGLLQSEPAGDYIAITFSGVPGSKSFILAVAAGVGGEANASYCVSVSDGEVIPPTLSVVDNFVICPEGFEALIVLDIPQNCCPPIELTSGCDEFDTLNFQFQMPDPYNGLQFKDYQYCVSPRGLNFQIPFTGAPGQNATTEYLQSKTKDTVSIAESFSFECIVDGIGLFGSGLYMGIKDYEDDIYVPSSKTWALMRIRSSEVAFTICSNGVLKSAFFGMAIPSCGHFILTVNDPQDPTTYRLYLNGTEYSPTGTSVVGSTLFGTVNIVQLMAGANTGNTDVTLLSGRVYTRAINAAEAISLYNTGLYKTVNDTRLVFDFLANKRKGDTGIDFLGNAYELINFGTRTLINDPNPAWIQPAASACYGWSATQTGNWLASMEVIDETGPVSFVWDKVVLNAYVGADINGKPYQGIEIDPQTLPCRFYLRFTFNYPEGEMVVCTEHYEKVVCQKTIKIIGEYPLTGKSAIDCSGNYYGQDIEAFCGDFVEYNNAMRLYGQIEYVGISTSTTTVNGVVRASSQTNKYRVRTLPVPPYVVDKLSTILRSKRMLIGGVEYTAASEVSKNNEVSNMWVLDFEVESVSDCQSQDFTCE